MINLTNIFAFKQLNQINESKEDDARLLKFLVDGIAEDDPYGVMDDDSAEEWAKEWFDLYKKLKDTNRLPADFKDQYKMMKTYSVDEIIDKLKEIRSTSSHSQQRKQSKNLGAKKAYEDDTWLILEILNYPAAKYYGRGTKWCIAGNYEGEEDKGEFWFDNYLETEYNHYYFTFNKKTGDKWSICTREGGVPDIWTAEDNKVFKIPGLPPIPGIYSEDSIKFKVENGVLIKAMFSRDDQDLIREIDLNVVAQEYGPIYEIGKGAFQYCNKLVTVILPDTCTKIAEDAFRESSIKQIVMRNVEEIGARAFSECWDLKHVNLNYKIKVIPDYCFYSCPLSNLSLASVEKIGKKAISMHFNSNIMFYYIQDNVKEIDAEFIQEIQSTKPPLLIFEGAPKITGSGLFLHDESLDGIGLMIDDADFVVKNFSYFSVIKNKTIWMNDNLKSVIGEYKYNVLMNNFKNQNVKYIETDKATL